MGFRGPSQTRVGPPSQAMYPAESLGPALFGVAHFYQHRPHQDNPLAWGGLSWSLSSWTWNLKALACLSYETDWHSRVTCVSFNTLLMPLAKHSGQNLYVFPARLGLLFPRPASPALNLDNTSHKEESLTYLYNLNQPTGWGKHNNKICAPSRLGL